MKKNQKQKSKGLGDTVAKITNLFGLNILAEKIAKLFGKEDCGCTRRKDKLNELIPYKKNK